MPGLIIYHGRDMSIQNPSGRNDLSMIKLLIIDIYPPMIVQHLDKVRILPDDEDSFNKLDR